MLTNAWRTALAGLRICKVNEPTLANEFKHIPHAGRRVLIPTDIRHVFERLTRHGGQLISVRLAALIERTARKKIGANYRGQARPVQAPDCYSCSTFTQSVYAFAGIHLPRYAIDQSLVGQPVASPDTHTGLAFYESMYPIRDEDRAIGHVGITTHDGMLIHGSMQTGTITEEPLPALRAICFTDPFPYEAPVLLIVPNKFQDLQTALDLARRLTRRI